LLESRLRAMDTAIQLLQSINDRVPANIDEKISALREIQDEKFTSIQLQFRERDVRTEQTSKDSKVAVDAALQAAKEAVGEQNKSSALAISKSEASTVKQIDQMGLLIQTGQKAVDDKFSDVKDRLTRIEGKDVGKAVAETTHQVGTNISVAIAGVVVAIIAIIAAVLMSGHTGR
jgi:tetrahydromethanopterin S-methyltransferase subunit G